ncbi:MAG: phospho-N-acetylmuramoyl-pentapeptide-transferase [Chloroflexota bacterium]
MAYSLFLGAVTFILAVIWGKPLLSLLKKYRVGKRIRIDGPHSHQVKMGTPTMGGLMIIVPVILITVAANFVEIVATTAAGRRLLDRLGVAREAFFGESLLVPMGVMITFAILGAVDDWAGVRGLRRGEGLRGRWQFLLQSIIATAAALVLHFGPPQLRSLALPGVADKIDINGLWIPMAVFVIVAFSNAVNLTDGLDGLAGSLAAVAFACYGVIALLQDQAWLVAFCFTVTGATMAFLWFNAHPADMFMGGVGSFALGATLAVVALMTGQWLLLPLIGLVFVGEVASVALQVSVFKYTRIRTGQGRRVFKMAPLHHHFELLGWSEMQVTQRFWLVGILAGMLGIALALWGNPAI